MARYQLEPGDYGLVRFAVSPLTELGNSLRALRAPASYPLQAPWYAAACRVRDQLPLDVLSGLIGPNFDTPDLFNPRVGVPLTIDAQLAYLRDQDLRALGADIEFAVGGIPRRLGSSGRSFGDRLADALAAYWQLAFEPHWPRMRATLEADVAHRARSLAAEGVIATLNGCGPGVRAESTTITAHILGHAHDDLTLYTRGRPMFVVPSLFTLSSSTPLADSDPMVVYRSIGQRSMWLDTSGLEAGAGLLSAHRLRYLRALGSGQSTTALATRFGVSPSAANQSLRALAAQGLVRARRSGRSVIYERTALGDQLADLRT
ncbi:ArsR/SmtB family transcription factor [Kribbella shirazensis]|uniref:DNA-binding transcriptional ArsR family regulator n=1 Tax=Kribbella shirazensis TaxID=1105143 RepID=A0A7X5VJN2_9ACTN|nr:winged helix-turn-helix domain-containing protein [Kribbella shirazensis]NIK62501.1 DNA-binding transcriptional ArsR family regulator [Kribbella shirazensis]